ncbi:hypothetical protein TWF569_002811 [Orbilia oligospora]|nr:hypothetical protein TWF569_002811 [Orbilia oligospora]
MSRFVKGGRYQKGTPETRLQVILKPGKTEGFSSEMDRTYLTILEQLEYSPEESASDLQGWMQFCKDFRTIVGTIVTLADPLNIRSLAYLLNITDDEVDSILRHLYSVLNVPSLSNSDQPVRLLHLSFKEFLTDSEKGAKVDSKGSKDRKNGTDSKCWYYIEERQTHSIIMTRCIDILSDNDEGLKENMCLMGHPGMSRRELGKSTIKEKIPEGSQYACRYWVHHLEQSGDYRDDEVRNCIYEFLRQYFLEWLEALSLIGQSSECINLVDTLRRLFYEYGESELSRFLYDAYRFLLQNWKVIDEAPLQIYSSCLIFCPQASIIKNLFQNRIQKVAFSPNNKYLASASSDHTIIIWDANLGEKLKIPKKHSGTVTDVAFSPDGKWLASASEDMTIRLWDIDAIIGRRTPATEKPIRVLRGHTSDVLSIAYSPDGKLLASGSASQDDAVILWDETGSFESDHSRGCFNAITFSPSGKEVALSMRNGTIELWDAETGKEITVFGTHDKDVVTAAFSPDGKILASASLDGKVGLWDTAIYCGGEKFKSVSWYKADDLTMIKTIEEHDDAGYGFGKAISKIVFSPDGKQVASGARGGEIIVWDVRTGRLLNRFRGGTTTICNLQFCPGNDNLIQLIASTTRRNSGARLWDITTGRQIHYLESDFSIDQMCFTSDGERLASLTGSDISLWNVEKGKRVKEFGVDFARYRYRYIYPPSAMTFCPNSNQLVIAREEDILVFDIAAGQIVQKVEMTKNISSPTQAWKKTIKCLHFSDDGQQLKTDQGVLALLLNPDTPGRVSLKPLPTPSIPYCDSGDNDYEWIT